VGAFDRAPVVRAAGGIVVRAGAAGPEVVVVRRARYDDWALPKGHVDRGESWTEAALREVEEETGVVGEITGDPQPVTYLLGDGRPKVVVFFPMRVVRHGTHPPSDEIDEVAWWPLDRATSDLTYPADRALVQGVAAAPGP
jgi:8-oxo-dGTP diphosphatase